MHEHSGLGREGRRLKRRADYFFASGAFARFQIADFADSLLALGPTVAIGGFPRDLYLCGNRQFRSDVDFVVDAASLTAFDRLTARLGGTPNSFGGCRIDLGRWMADVWPLERTLAAVFGHVTVSCMRDLLRTTFFDWDAILYSVGDRKLITDHAWFDRINRRVLDINLEPNPNPLGAAVRAIRCAYRWEAAFGERLAAHVAKQIMDHGWQSLADRDRCSFPSAVLGGLDGDAVFAAVHAHSRNGGAPLRLPLRPAQTAFDLVGGCARPPSVPGMRRRRQAVIQR